MMRQSFGDTMNAFSSMGAMEPSSWVQQMQEQWIGDGADEVIDMPSPEEMMNAKPSINSATTSLLRLPIVGRVHWLFDIQGMTQCSVTFLYWVYGMWYTYNVLLWPHVREHHMHPGILYVYGVIGALTITSLVRATLSDPGRVYDHMQKQASSDDTEWTWCKTCCFKRPARAHHCRRCQHCVLRMDHHCPWINNCVGEGNHFAFVQLVFYAFVMSFTTLTLITVHKYYIPPCTLGDPDSIVVKHEKGLTMLSIILSLVMTCAGCGLFIMNHVSAMMDMTTIDWMKFQRLLKEKKKPPIPYVKKSCDKAYYDLCGPGLFLLYPFPCRRRRFMPTLALTHEV